MHRTFFDLIGREHLSTSLIGKLERGGPSESMFAVFLGLDGSPELTASLGRFQASHVWFICPDGERLLVVWLDKDDPSAAPPGKHALWLGKLSHYEKWEGLSRDVYRGCKQDQARELVLRAEELIPSLSRHIQVMEAASPLTYERYTLNWRGATTGWSWDSSRNPQIVFSRDVNLRNFYCVGHWMHSPGGVPAAMATAWYIAREVIKNRPVDQAVIRAAAEQE